MSMDSVDRRQDDFAHLFDEFAPPDSASEDDAQCGEPGQ